MWPLVEEGCYGRMAVFNRSPKSCRPHPLSVWMSHLPHAIAKLWRWGKHPFRVVKRQFNDIKVRYRGPVKNAAQLNTPVALANLWIVRRASFWGAVAECR